MDRIWKMGPKLRPRPNKGRNRVMSPLLPSEPDCLPPTPTPLLTPTRTIEKDGRHRRNLAPLTSCMEEQNNNNNKKRKLQLDWDKLFIEDTPLPELEVTGTASSTTMGGGDNPPGEELCYMTDDKLDDLISRQKGHIVKLGPKLPDKGEKLKAALKRSEDEKERRNSRKMEQGDACNKDPQSGASNGFRQGAAPSCFGSIFSRKIDEDREGRTVNAFTKELSTMNACVRKKRGNRVSSPKAPQKSRYSSRQAPFKCPISIPADDDNGSFLNGNVNNWHSSSPSPHHLEEDRSDLSIKKNHSQVQSSRQLRPRNGQTVVSLDEEEPELAEIIQVAEITDDSLKDITVYYPSRDDPKSIEIVYSDMECLAPEAYLSSTVMNFYIRYLQQPMSLKESKACDYHFFNTYFYKKLKEAKRGDRESSLKFRRWWKGVDLFEKAYILLPVHEHLHWSLVIICNPDKEADSGPLILHLDSLGLHDSNAIFKHIRIFLKEEWKFLMEESPTYLPLANRIWENLPRRIGDEIIKVPQQKNDYDCGLFVLYFMEHFIEQAPERMKTKDTKMFGKQWFRPEEASGLRQKIKSLLLAEFKKKQVIIEDVPDTSPIQTIELG